MNHIDVRHGQEQQGSAELLGKLACQIQRDPAKIGVTQQLVEIVGEQFKDKTQVVTKHERALELYCGVGMERICHSMYYTCVSQSLTNIVLALRIVCIQKF